MSTLLDVINHDRELRASGGVLPEPETELPTLRTEPLDPPQANALRGELLAWRLAHPGCPLPGVELGPTPEDWWQWCCRADVDLLRQALDEAQADSFLDAPEEFPE